MISVVSVINIFGAHRQFSSWSNLDIKQCIIHFLPSDSRFGDCHVLAFFFSAVLSWLWYLPSDTWPGRQQTRHWLVHWQVTTQVPGGTSLHWSQVVTGDYSWHRRATRVPQVQCWQLPDADITQVTRPGERGEFVSSHHSLICTHHRVQKIHINHSVPSLKLSR